MCIRDSRNAGDFDTRVAFVLGEMAAGDFDAPREVPLLAAAWGLSTDHTRRIVRAAGAAYRASTPDLDALRAASMGRWMHLYRAALAADDVRAAAVALVGHDKVSGAANGAKAPESPIEQHPEFLAAAAMYVDAVHDALDVGALARCLPDIPRGHLERAAAAALEAVERRLTAVQSGEDPPAMTIRLNRGPVDRDGRPLPSVKILVHEADVSGFEARLMERFADRPDVLAEIQAARA